MDFPEYWDSMSKAERTVLAERSGVSRQYLWALAKGGKKAGVETIAQLNQIDRKITLKMMRPDLYL